MAHVFVSYSKKNRLYARQLAESLLEQGFRVWIDDRIEYGENWWKEIVGAIQSCAAFVVIMTPDAEASRWVEREVALAEHYRKPMFPLLLEGENWPLFVLTQYADVRHGQLPEAAFFDRLAEHAPRRVEGGENVTPAPADETAAPLQPLRPPARSAFRFVLPAALALAVIVAALMLNAAGMFRPAAPTPAPTTPAASPTPAVLPTPTPAPAASGPRPLLLGERLRTGDVNNRSLAGPFVRGADGQVYLMTSALAPGTVVIQAGRTRAQDMRVGEAVAAGGDSPLARLIGLVRLDGHVPVASVLPGGQPLKTAQVVGTGAWVRIASRNYQGAGGAVQEVNRTVSIFGADGNGPVELTHMLIAAPASDQDDQGGLVVDEQGHAVGVLVGGSLTTSIIAPMADVLSAFQVELIAQPADCSPAVYAELELVCEHAAFALAVLNELLGDVRGMPTITLLDESERNSFVSDDGIYHAPASLAYLPDIVYDQMAHYYIREAADLLYRGQSGAIYHSYRNILASIVKQKRLGQTAQTADWVLAPGAVAWINGEDVSRTNDLRPLYSLKAPGTAFDDPRFSAASQVAHMDDYTEITADSGGVHIYSGIPNKAFYETAIQIGSDAALRIWLDALYTLDSDSDFQRLAEATLGAAEGLFGTASDEQRAVAAAWGKVGITVT